MTLPKWSKDALFMGGIFAAAIGIAYIAEGPDATYVITDKKANKITYRDMDGSNTHVMEFDIGDIEVGYNIYPYLDVDDTICGHARTMDQANAKSWYMNGGQMAAKTPAIRAINGVKVSDIPGADVRKINAEKLKARRDSILRKIQQKQR